MTTNEHKEQQIIHILYMKLQRISDTNSVACALHAFAFTSISVHHFKLNL
jgi:hypothetical protein